MSIQMSLPNVLVDLSTDEQQLLTGGQFFDGEFEDGEDSSDRMFSSDRGDDGRTRRYRVRSIGILSLRRLR